MVLDYSDLPQRPSPPVKKAKSTGIAKKPKSYLDEVKEASVTADFYTQLGKRFDERFCEGCNDGITVLHPSVADLQDTDAFIANVYKIANEVDAPFVKVVAPQEYVDALRATEGYPFFHPLNLKAIRENIQPYETAGRPGVYIRNAELYDYYSAREFLQPGYLAPGTTKQWKPKKVLQSPFDPSLDTWRKCESDFWNFIPRSSNSKVLYCPEIDGSLYPQSFKTFNLSTMRGLLRSSLECQGHIPGIFTSVVYFGQARSSFPLHTEDFELFSVNFMHFGAPKLWYGIPPSQFDHAVKSLRRLYPQPYHCNNAARHKTFFPHPDVLKSCQLDVVKTLQKENEFIITNPYAYHMGFLLGISAGEAINFAHKDISVKIVKDVISRELYCHCAFNVQGVMINPQVFDFNHYVASMEKLNRDNRHLRDSADSLRNQVEHLTREMASNAPSTSGCVCKPPTMRISNIRHFEDEFDTLGDNDDNISFSGHSPTKQVSFNSGPSPTSTFADASNESEDYHEEDRNTSSRLSTTSTKRGRGWNGGGKAYSTAEDAAILECLKSHGLYDDKSGKLTDAYRSLGAYERPTGKSFWKANLKEETVLSNRSAESLRKYFPKRFNYLL